MRYWLLSLFAFLATHAVADDLSDFSNDLATDVGPLLVLFGESMTRQYLSESTSFLDYFIFAMAPIGIITAITSAIRVCGHSTLRAFIGRSQEGDGVVEAELCTSTSRDVCELFNKGGITRVLGRPQVLELIHIKHPDQKDDLQLFRHYLESSRSLDNMEWINVERYKPGIGHLPDDSSSNHIQFAPKPNLSLNVGIKRRPKWVFVFIAILGCLLQGGVLALAGVGVWVLGWNLSESGSPASTNYAPVMFITGTVVMCGGMFWCAALIGQTTKEVRYSRKPGKPQSRLLWLQPGRQVIGDQSFDAFAHLENTDEEPLQVWTSSRKAFDERFELYTFFAVASVLLGYISQFIGLRGMKAWISLAQLGITVTMSILRGLLRVQRLGRDANKLGALPDMVAGHELDWLSFELSLGSSVGNTSFCFTGRHNKVSSPGIDSPPGCDPFPYNYAESKDSSPRANQIDFDRVLHIRQRLSHLTGHNSTRINDKEAQLWETSQVKARDAAKQLAAALSKLAERLIRKEATKDKITVQIQVAANTGTNGMHERQMINIDLRPPRGSETEWSVDSSLLEAILGLSMWSLVSAQALHDTDQTGNTISLFEDVEWRRIIHYSPDDQQTCDSDTSTHSDPSIDVSIWFGADARRLVHDRIKMNMNCIVDPTTLRIDPRVSLFKHQLCGWNTVHDSLQSPLGLESSSNSGTDDTTLMVLLAPTKDSLHQICTQDLFLAIVSSLVNILVTEETAIMESEGHVLLQNSTVTTISDILVESGLATRFEALSCAVSLLATRLYPNQDVLLSNLIELADVYRRNSEWERAETLMQWACFKSLKPGYKIKPPSVLPAALFHEDEYIMLNEQPVRYDESSMSVYTLNRIIETLQATGELYRWSCAQYHDKIRLEFGIQGIGRMSRSFKNLSDQNSGVREVLTNYQHVANLMKDRAATDQPQQNLSERNDTTGQDPLVEALQLRDRKMALYNLCFTITGLFNSYHLHPALPLASRNGWTEIVNAILEMRGGINNQDEDYRTSVSYCAEHGHMSLLQHFIGLGASVNIEDNLDRTPLHYAVMNRQEMAVNTLLETRSIERNKKDKYGFTALDWAMTNSPMGTIRLLLDFEARLEPNARLGYGSTIMETVITGDKATLDALLDRNIDVNSKDTPHHPRALTKAVNEGDKTAVELLLKWGVKVDAPGDNSSRSNLLVALEQGNKAIIRLILESEHTSLVNPSIWSSLLFAIISGYWTYAQGILQEYISVAAELFGNETTSPPSATSPKEAVLDLLQRIRIWRSALKSTETSNVDEQVMDWFVIKGVEFEARNIYGESMMIVGVKKGNIEWIKLMLANGADVDYPDHRGRTALSYACEEGNEYIVRLLLEYKADTGIRDTDGLDALCYASKAGNDSIVALVSGSYEKDDFVTLDGDGYSLWTLP